MTHSNFRSLLKSERHRFVLYVRSLLKTGSAMDAEDVVQDVLLKMLEKADLNVPLENMTAYVYRSLKNKVIDYLRANKLTLSLDHPADDDSGNVIDLLIDHRPNALEELQTEDGKKALFAALEKLTEIERTVIIAHGLQGATFRELSQRWEVPQNTLLSHQSRAMKKLKRHFLES